MQTKSAEKSKIAERLAALHTRSGGNWSDLAARLEASESMIHQVRRGERTFSPQKLERLERIEQAERLKEALKLSGRTINDLAKELQSSLEAASGWLVVCDFPDALFTSIGHALRVSPRWLRTGEGDPLDYARSTAKDREAAGELHPLSYTFLAEASSSALAEPGHEYAAEGARGSLQQARRAKGLDFPALARITRLKATYLRDLEEGRVGITEESAGKIARALGISPADLMEGSEAANIIDLSGRTGAVGTTPQITLPHGQTARFAPTLSYTQAGALHVWTDDVYNYEGVVAMDLPPKTRAFSLTIRGDSMEPKFFAGDVAIVLWGVEPRNGQVVVACTTDGDVMCKLYSTQERGEKVTLTSYNSLHPPVETRREDLRWVFPVHSFNRRVMMP